VAFFANWQEQTFLNVKEEMDKLDFFGPGYSNGLDKRQDEPGDLEKLYKKGKM
jgi:hypothetical protein